MESKFLCFKLALLLLLLLAAPLIASALLDTDIRYCTKKAYPVKVEDVVITPYPVKTGHPTTFTIEAETDEGLTGGNLILDVTYFGVKVHSETDDICEKTSCPIPPGKFELTHTQTLPIFTPPGKYTLKMRLSDNKRSQLTCIRFTFTIGFGSSAVSDI